MLTIGELSKATGANISTIRHYERVGLLPAPSRSDGNQRRYTDSARAQLAFISQARDLGISIDDIRDMIELTTQPSLEEADARRIVGEQLSNVTLKMSRLTKLHRELERLSRLDPADNPDSRLIEVLALETRPGSQAEK
ncbi:MerR family transcriptional regulator [Rhizobium sp.]|uniref:MerR family transcriptional regulator n=1 Tax=Rhizobium sp. TaxID=391 RepID=UPI0028B24A1A